LSDSFGEGWSCDVGPHHGTGKAAAPSLLAQRTLNSTGLLCKLAFCPLEFGRQMAWQLLHTGNYGF
jgi:hypothetical protein